ncbi:hypothetical protein CNECB9_2610036 [Cupriavidus necator]|uniref:Phasin domain-containing protein n=1 Tax=Cupriavidus necator TaxID=106590 RepID=A0A1K0IFI6_CUPNE|nr:hypothetical protein CNECB9_2610036 [Cupriavidus necator]
MYVSGSDHLDAALKAQGAAMVALTSVAFGCVGAAQLELQQVINADYEQNRRRAQDYVAHVVKHLPACADATVALWQSALVAANGTYEAAIQASEVATANMAAANKSRVPA